MTEWVDSFSNIFPEALERVGFKANWVVKTADGQEIPDWSEVIDPRYGSIRHVIVKQETEQGSRFFDKVDLDWSPAAFVVVFRRNQGRVEFLLPEERRMLLRDNKGIQGQVSIRNIPQGLVKTWQGETPEQAALRETKEETGLDPIAITGLGNIYFDAANSETAMPFFMAEVPFEGLTYNQSLDETEHIEVSESDWYALEDIPKLKLECAKTLSGIMLATGFLGLWPSQNPQK